MPTIECPVCGETERLAGEPSEGTITVTWDGLSTTAPIATGPDDPTCVTTLQLG